jgi:hypothetical protein
MSDKEVTLKDADLSDAEKGLHSDDEYDVELGYGKLQDSDPKESEKDSDKQPPEDEKKVDEGKPDPAKSQEEPVIQIDDITKDVEQTRLTDENKRLQGRVQELENITNGIKELEKDPLVFVQRYFPDLAKQLNPDQNILMRVRNELKLPDDFRYDPQEAYIEGTESYKFRLKENEIRDNYVRERAKLEADQRIQGAQREESFKQSKAKVIKMYGITEEQYQKNVVDYAKNTVLLPEHFARLVYLDAIVKSAVEKALKSQEKRKNGEDKKKVPGVAEIVGTEETGSEHLKDLNDTFGDIL